MAEKASPTDRLANDETSDQLQIIQDGLWQFNSKDGFRWRFPAATLLVKDGGEEIAWVHGKALVEIDIENGQPL